MLQHVNVLWNSILNYSGIKESELLMQVTIWMNLKDFLLKGKSHIPKSIFYMIACTWHPGKSKNIGKKNSSMIFFWILERVKGLLQKKYAGKCWGLCNSSIWQWVGGWMTFCICQHMYNFISQSAKFKEKIF